MVTTFTLSFVVFWQWDYSWLTKLMMCSPKYEFSVVIFGMFVYNSNFMVLIIFLHMAYLVESASLIAVHLQKSVELQEELLIKKKGNMREDTNGIKCWLMDVGPLDEVPAKFSSVRITKLYTPPYLIRNKQRNFKKRIVLIIRELYQMSSWLWGLKRNGRYNAYNPVEEEVKVFPLETVSMSYSSVLWF